MAEASLSQIASLFGIPLWLLFIVLIWNLFWKGMALWKSARKSHATWFVVFLLIQTMGILEILYIFLFADFKERLRKEKKEEKREERKTKKRRMPRL